MEPTHIAPDPRGLQIRDLREALVAAIGPEQVADGDSERDLHAADLSFHVPHRPDLVVYPTSTEDVSRTLALATEHRVPVTAFGAGTSLEGHVIPLRGGISLDLSRMTRLLELSPENLTATVQAGMTRLTLTRAAGEHGLFFPVDPGADATLGGMAATNAAGTTTVRYGKTRANVLALEAVLADGSVIRTGTRARKTSAGYDLTGLLVGSEGTLAVITEVTVRLHPIAEHAVALRISFPDIEAVCRTAATIVAAGAGVTRLELLDGWVVSAINAYSGTSFPEGPCLFVEATGTREMVEADLELAEEIARGEGAVEIVVERDADARARLWKARHDMAHAVAAKIPGTKERATDVCVPLTELAGAVQFARAEIDRLGLNAGIAGHAGDGNVHVSIHADPDDADEMRRSDELVQRIVDDALARGGTCTGEHGIGQGKIGALIEEHGDLIALMQGIKQVFDPLGIMNPGKVLPARDEPGPEAAMRLPASVHSRAEGR
jgi:D-lactate dehydrogenase (cytochrome)